MARRRPSGLASRPTGGARFYRRNRMHKGLSSILFVIFMGALCAFLRAEPATTKAAVALPEMEARTHTEPGGKTLPYRLLVPKDYVKGEHRPLVLWLHGAGERGTDNRAQLRALANTFLGGTDAAKFPAFVLAPQCPKDSNWVTTGLNEAPTISEPTRMVMAAVQEVVKEFEIDDRRIYVGGFSMGGYGTWEVLKFYPNVFAAGFPIAGGEVFRPGLAGWVKHVPVWIFHGDQDDTVPVQMSRKMAVAVKAAGGTVKYTELAGVTHSMTQAIREPGLPAWILAQQREKPADFARAKLPDDVAANVQMPGGVDHGTWKATALRIGKTGVRFEINDVFFRARAAEGNTAVAEALAKIGRGEAEGPCEVTAKAFLQGPLTWLEIEKITFTK
jgi:predicted esterase